MRRDLNKPPYFIDTAQIKSLYTFEQCYLSLFLLALVAFCGKDAVIGKTS